MIAPKQLGRVELISDMATGGTLAVTRIEQYRAVQIAQSTAGQVLTLPAPIDTGVRFGLDVANTGTVSFEMGSRTVGAGSVMRFYWTGSAWVEQSQDQLISQDDNTFVTVTNGQIEFTVGGNVVGSMTYDSGLGMGKFTWPGALDPVSLQLSPQTIAQRNSLVATLPLTKIGWMVYVVDGATKEVQIFDGTSWSTVGGSSAYTAAHNGTSDWVASGSEFVLQVPFSLHGKARPQVVSYEDVGANLVRVEPNLIQVDEATNDVSIYSVTRYAGMVSVA